MSSDDSAAETPWWAKILSAGLVVVMLGWYLVRLTERIDANTAALTDLRIAIEAQARRAEPP